MLTCICVYTICLQYVYNMFIYVYICVYIACGKYMCIYVYICLCMMFSCGKKKGVWRAEWSDM